MGAGAPQLDKLPPGVDSMKTIHDLIEVLEAEIRSIEPKTDAARRRCERVHSVLEFLRDIENATNRWARLDEILERLQ